VAVFDFVAVFFAFTVFFLLDLLLALTIISKKRKFISTLIPLFISVLCLNIHGLEAENGTYA
jgi:hypothetical protein